MRTSGDGGLALADAAVDALIQTFIEELYLTDGEYYLTIPEEDCYSKQRREKYIASRNKLLLALKDLGL